MGGTRPSGEEDENILCYFNISIGSFWFVYCLSISEFEFWSWKKKEQNIKFTLNLVHVSNTFIQLVNKMSKAVSRILKFSICIKNVID